VSLRSDRLLGESARSGDRRAHGVRCPAELGVRTRNASGQVAHSNWAGNRLVCSAGSSLLIRNLLFGVEAWDALSLSLVALLLEFASMTALPARRAASVNPVEALRTE